MIKRMFNLAISKKRIISICFILILIFVADYIVYLTGGTKFAFTHLMYIPIIISAFVFDIKGAVGAAFLGGIILGPLMPVNVSEGIMQEPSGWILRTSSFVIIGLVIGFLFQRIKMDKEIQIKKSFINTITGFPNASKLKLDLNEMINKQKSFSLIIFKIINLDHINRYIDYSIGEKSLFKAIEILSNLVDKDNIYSIFTNEFAVTMWGCSIEGAYLKAKEFLDYFKEPVLIDGVPVNLVIKVGISNYPLHGKEENDLFKKMGRTLDQEEFDGNEIAIYESSISQKNKEKYETVVSIYDAIKNDRFTIAYQPIINLKRNEVKGVEALLRWNNSKNMNPGEFIKIAEDAGIISEITRWVIKNAIDQLKKWQEEGIKTKISINISSKDLKDDSIIEYTADYIKVSQIEPTLLEFELTERVIVENENKVEYLLNRIKNIGIKISLDDFGTGYNSLVHLVKLPIDYLKIDKFFMDNIKDIHHRFLIKGIINLAHNLGKEVIAEGVETEGQLKLLNNMSCDSIQGYYFSKPLPPDELKEFILNFKQ